MERCNFCGRSYRNFDEDLFKENLSDHNWDNIMNFDDVDLKWADYHQTITNILDQMCPIKKFKISKFKQPWITPQLLELIKDKDLKLRKAKKSKLTSDLVEARKTRNICTKRLCKA